jgi:hypothetical protein
MSLRSVTVLTLFTSVLCCLFMGCSSNNESAEVTGTILVDGQLAQKGSMSFVPEDGKSQTAGCEIKDGKYLATVPAGKMKVEIRIPTEDGKKEIYPGQFAPKFKEILPEKYNTKTTLTMEVKPGKNEKDWVLATK